MKNQGVAIESVLLVLAIGYLVWQRYGAEVVTWWKARGQKRKRAWTWRPRTPKDCPVCRAEARSMRKLHRRMRYGTLGSLPPVIMQDAA